MGPQKNTHHRFVYFRNRLHLSFLCHDVLGGLLITFSFKHVLLAHAIAGWIPFFVALTLHEPPYEKMVHKDHWLNFRGVFGHVFFNRNKLLMAVAPIVGYLCLGIFGGIAAVGLGLLFQLSRGICQVLLRDALNWRTPAAFRATANSLQSFFFRLGLAKHINTIKFDFGTSLAPLRAADESYCHCMRGDDRENNIHTLKAQVSKKQMPHICLRNETSHTLEIFVNNEPEILGPKETISAERPLNGTFIVQLDTHQTSTPKAEPLWEEASTENVMVEGCNSLNTVIVSSKKRPSDENALAMNL